MLQPATVQAFDGARLDRPRQPARRSGALRRDPLARHLPRRAARRHVAARPRRPLGRRGAGAGSRPAGSATATEIMALNVYNGKLYGAAIPRAEVFRYERDGSWTSLRRLFDPPGWRPVLVRNMAARRTASAAMREWTRVTSLTQHDGLAVRVGRQLHERGDRRAGRRPRHRSTRSARASSRRRRARSSRAGATSPPSAAARHAHGLRRRPRGGCRARGAVTRIDRDRRPAPHRRGRDRSLRRRDRRLPDLRPRARTEIKREIAAPCTTRRQRHEALESRHGRLRVGGRSAPRRARPDRPLRGRGDLHVARRSTRPSSSAAHGRPIEVVRDFDDLIARPDIDVIDLCSRSNLHAEPGDRRGARPAST